MFNFGIKSFSWVGGAIMMSFTCGCWVIFHAYRRLKADPNTFIPRRGDGVCTGDHSEE